MGAWTLAKRALALSESEAEPGRVAAVWAIAGFSVWLPGARFLGVATQNGGLPAPLVWFFVGSWTVACAWLFRQLWRERGHAPLAPVVEDRIALGAAVWRAVGALLIVAWLRGDLNEPRAEGIFSAAISWPTRAAFAWVFLTSRLKV
ncbi:MAG: hypothetical protein M0D55_18935 [Elusimicrobiota bacterium]|nr:MAG: hypothetical protein M0D55_18935 [Elusimicrobiota bacterium]